MCGRYHFSSEGNEDLFARLRTPAEASLVKTGEVFPTDHCLILTAYAAAEVMTWGFPGFKHPSHRIINARCETVHTKPLFKTHFQRRRCVVPTDGFYEWDAHLPTTSGKKRRYLFKGQKERLYLAGIWSPDAPRPSFVILTTIANPEMAPIHDRMPVLLSENQLTDWMEDNAFALRHLQTHMPTLKMVQVP